MGGSQPLLLCPERLPKIQGRFESEIFKYIHIQVKGCNLTDVSEDMKCLDDIDIMGQYI